MTRHPAARPIFRWRPERDKGIPILRDSLPLADDRPMARFHENENPYFLPIEFSVERHSPPTPTRRRGFDCGLRVERSWRIELAAGQVLGATPCSTLLFL